jgi:protein-S-isoprenylcysteine O-methyltransferase Ste14
MTSTEWEAVAAVYLPLSAAIILGILNAQRSRLFAACLLSFLWTMPALLALQEMNLRVGWWSFSGDSIRINRMPIECFAGWAILWGLVPQLALSRFNARWLVAIMVSVDLIAMPACKPLVLLGSHWLVGELLAVLTVLMPAILIAQWTLKGTHLRARAALQMAISALIFLYLLPEVAFALRPGAGWAPLFQLPSWQTQIAMQVLLLIAVPGISAVMEFAERGSGTPIPYDPPRRLVTSGIYRYCANPMQISCAVAMLFWAGLLRNGWLVLAAAISVVYSAGIARWDEAQDLGKRFGGDWRLYRASVHNWHLRWKPYHAGPDAVIYVARSCGPCREMRAWLEAKDLVGLKVVDAEELATGSIRRIRYDAGDGSELVEGVRAVGRALEHINLSWAFAGFFLRMPGVLQSVQLLMDASGFGPRTLGTTVCE